MKLLSSHLSRLSSTLLISEQQGVCAIVYLHPASVSQARLKPDAVRLMYGSAPFQPAPPATNTVLPYPLKYMQHIITPILAANKITYAVCTCRILHTHERIEVHTHIRICGCSALGNVPVFPRE